MGGEKSSGISIVALNHGSSPRGWGKASRTFYPRNAFRIIPTWVGKRSTGTTSDLKPSDHPHVGGEKRFHAWSFCHSIGSSPRGWGKDILAPQPPVANRIIPTWVGKRGDHAGVRVISADHPHVGGEKSTTDWRSSSSLGSSPRGWGKVCERGSIIWDDRIIPTWVGKRTVGTATPS